LRTTSNALFEVYIILIFVYILLKPDVLRWGLRLPYARLVGRPAVVSCADVCEPYLKIFRRFIPTIGMFDFSPMIAIIVLYVADRLVVNAISG